MELPDSEDTDQNKGIQEEPKLETGDREEPNGAKMS